MMSGLGILSVSLACLAPLTGPAPPPQEEDWPSWAPDSQRLVYECYRDGPTHHDDWLDLEGPYQSYYTEEAADLCISDIDGRNQVHLVDDSGGNWHPSWSPDGSHIAYLRDDGIYWITPEGKHRRQRVPMDYSRMRMSWLSMDKGIVKWSPDGELLLFSGCLDHQDHDVYVVDVDIGVMKNLTPNSRAHDFSPMWTLDGSKIVFLSTPSSETYGCGPGEDALPQMNVINSGGSEERIVYDPEFYYPYWQVSVSNSGQIAFVTDMSSRTQDEYFSDDYGDLYVVDVIDGELSKMLAAVDYGGRISLPTWSPNGEYMAYKGFTSSFVILNVMTGEVIEPQQHLSINPRFVWSPDSKRIAVTVSKRQDFAIDSEEHIQIFDIQSKTFSPLIQENSSP